MEVARFQDLGETRVEGGFLLLGEVPVRAGYCLGEILSADECLRGVAACQEPLDYSPVEFFEAEIQRSDP